MLSYRECLRTSSPHEEGEKLSPSHAFLCASCRIPLSYLSTKEEDLLIIKQYKCRCGRIYDIHFARICIYERTEDVALMSRCSLCCLLYPYGEKHFC